MTATSLHVSEYTREELAALIDAENAWRDANDNLWLFAEPAAAVVGRHKDGLTADLAKRIGRSVDAVEGYAAAWRLWLKLLERYPSQSETWRAELYIGHFTAVAKKWNSKWISLTDAANYLHMAVKEGLSVDDLRRKLPGKDNTDSTKMMRRYIKSLDRDFIHAPRLGVPPSVVRAAKLLKARLERVK